MVGLLLSLGTGPDRTPVNTQDEAVSPLMDVEKILDCQMRLMASNHPVPKQMFVNKYLVKWKGISYLHCSWVPVNEFEKAYKTIGDLETRVNQFHSKMESLGNNKYDYVAIPPEWTTVDRVISSREEDGQRKYLVKFNGLSYDECYWESESDISTFQSEIQRFIDINSGQRRGIYVDHERNHEGFKQFSTLTPEFITGSLHPHQLEGLNLLRSAWSNRTHVVLADEMGQGTPIQSIAFLASLLEENVAPFLVVVSPSTLRNWERVFAAWAPHMNVVVYDGTSQARNVIINHEFYFPRGHNGVRGESKQDRIKFDVILTSYEMIDVDTAVLQPIKWKCMIVDEGYELKNENPKLFYSLKQYTYEHHVLLTGRQLQVGLVGRVRTGPERTPVYTQDNAVNPLTEMEKILDYQMRPMASKQVFVNQYLVKWKGSSYLHCSWVSEHEFEKAYKSITGLETMVNRFRSTMESLGNNYVAIPPEWTTVDRIISCREENNKKEYLVKFKELSYAECYWESESDISTFQKEIQRFKDINSGQRRGIYVDHKRNHEGFKPFDLTPEFITGSLDPDHLKGLNFLLSAWSNRTRVVLVDEMGLGTTQSIAFLASLLEENLAPFLVVASPSTLRKWEREFATWAPHMNVVVYDGTSQARNVIIKHEFYFPRGHNGVSGETKQDRIKFDVILTSYEMVDVDTAVLKPIKWKCMIVDKCHSLKNENPKLFYSLKQYTTEHHVLLTEKSLQVATSEYIDDNEAAAVQEAQAIGNKSSAGDSDEHQAEELTALGKRKRNHEQIIEKQAEPTDGEASRQGNKKTRGPYRRRTHRTWGPIPLIEGQGKSLSVLGFRESQRKTFIDTLMRYGVGNYEWQKFVHPLNRKTYDEIKTYGIFFLKHIIKDTQDDTNPPTFSDMVPKKELTRNKVLARITVMKLLHDKVKLIETHPGRAVFPDQVIKRFTALMKEEIWKKEHDKLLLRAVSKHGFGKWIDIVNDKEFDLEHLICKVLKVPIESLIPTDPNQKDPQRKLADFLRRRFEILEKAMGDECTDEYYYRGGRTERPLQGIAIADIRMSLSTM